ncbi:hypothetical protein PFLUV_G00169590 [Perca fluviatilis]|uniref:Peptidase S1 domain-containing protein n=1 Tax=Perca fluviatilis TaxID=8168 RepID=A0A6A5DZN1_PERFL|nr:hypothetical protein PFLUV_G00169590 [Perca fluviatilis]
MASVSRVARRLFVLRILLFIASLPACTGLPGARVNSSSCYFNNGECEHFCRHVPEPVCFCAPGYRLHPDGRTCTPQVAVACGRLQTHFAPSVINGMICPKGHCPWQALLTEHGNFSCGAIVLSRRWVLTAAHCVWAKPASIFNVTVNTTCVHEGTEQQRAVVKVLVHPGYNMSQHGHDSDVAMLRLQRPVKLGLYVVPVCLPARNSTFSHTLGTVRHSTVSGWGRLAQFGATAGVLQRLTLPRVSLQECQQHTRLNITRNMFCAGLKAGGRDACKGDSGRPHGDLLQEDLVPDRRGELGQGLRQGEPVRGLRQSQPLPRLDPGRHGQQLNATQDA